MNNLGFTDDDRRIVAEQLGREPRGLVGVAARCECGVPLVVTTAPRLPDGTPFPTLYYLTHPALSAAVARLEADGWMRDLNERLATDQSLADRYQAAHLAYLADRAKVAQILGLAEVSEIAGISAGGMPNRVKCLHALAGHALAAGNGVNPIGDQVLAELGWPPDKCWCDPATPQIP